VEAIGQAMQVGTGADGPEQHHELRTLFRFLPARSEMSTTLTAPAQMSDLLAPISKSTTHT